MENKHNHIDNLFKKGTEHYAVKPSAGIWDAIAAELDNAPVKSNTRVQIARYAAILVVFIGVLVFNTPENRQTRFVRENPVTASEIAANNTPAFTTTELNTLQTTAFAQNAIVTPNGAQREHNVEAASLLPVLASVIKPKHVSEEYIFLPQLPEDPEEVLANMYLYERIFNTDDPVELLGFDPFSYEDEDAEEDVIANPAFAARYRDLDMRGFYVGATGSYNQVSLLEYGNQFKGTRPIQPSLKFGLARGVKMGYNFSNSFGIEAEYVYNAEQGQNYVMSEDGEIVQKTLSLSYDLIPVVAKVKVGRVSKITNQPIVLNYTAGVQYGILRDARMPQDKRYEESAEELFKPNDFSLVLGLEYDIHVQENLIVSAGARGTFSNDISTHIEPLDDYAKRNFVFGLRAGISYMLN